MNQVHILETYDAQRECGFVCLIKSINGIKKSESNKYDISLPIVQ